MIVQNVALRPRPWREDDRELVRDRDELVECAHAQHPAVLGIGVAIRARAEIRRRGVSSACSCGTLGMNAKPITQRLRTARPAGHRA